MRILFWGLAIFIAAFSFHLIVWKVRLPRRHTKVMLQMFVFTFIGGTILLFVAPVFFPGTGRYVPTGLREYLHVSLLFISLTLSYILIYTAIEADSPSLVIVNTIAKAGPDGLEEDRLAQMVNDDILIKPRIRDLVKDKMLSIDKDKYKITPKGILLVRTILLHRNLLTTRKGG